MKKEYINVNANKLHDELMANGINPLLVEHLNGKAWVTFDDKTDMKAVQMIVDAHDPTPLPPQTTKEELMQAEIDQLKAKLADIEKTDTVKAELIALKEPIVKEPILKG